MDPIEDITFKKDTSLALMDAAQRKGWDLFYMEQSDLALEQGRATAQMTPITVKMDPENWFQKGEPAWGPLSDMDVVLMRKDPPFDNQYIYSTYILERAEQEGTLIVNNPQSLRDCNEKVFATAFPQCCPEVLVSQNAQKLKEFHAFGPQKNTTRITIKRTLFVISITAIVQAEINSCKTFGIKTF